MIYRTHFSILFFFIGTLVYSQVGINTNSPRGVFHVDGLSNTPASGAVTTAQEADDVIVTDDGRVGIGTIAPLATAKMDVRGKVRIADGTTINNNSVLFTDNNGYAHWELPKSNVILATNLGNGINFTLNTPNTYDKWLNTGGIITVPPGKSIIQASLYNQVLNMPANAYIGLWYKWSDSSSSLTKNNFKYINAGQEGLVIVLGSYPSNEMVGAGYWIIENTTNADINLYLFASARWNSIPNTGNTQLIGVGSGQWPETLIAVFPSN